MSRAQAGWSPGILERDVPVVRLENVWKIFSSVPPVLALRGVDLQITRGEYVSIVGPSGSGKSTLLHIIGCLDHPTSGRYRLDGVDVGKLRDDHRTAMRGQRIGFVFQAFHLMPYRSAIENVEAAGLYDATPARARRARAFEVLNRVGLGHRVNFPPRHLSGGECQRVAIARALLSGPSLLLADEPTGSLDSTNTESLLSLFDELRAEGLTLVVVTHDDSVSQRAGRVVRIVDGVLVEDSG